jgi:dipeptidyl aminopeptidase/acylaminoacyl peptidase
MRAVQTRLIGRMTGAAALGVTLAVAVAPSARPVAAQRTPASVLSQLTWFSRTGTVLARVGPIADHGNLELSPDGTRVAVAVMDQSTRTRSLWIYDAKSGSRTRFTTGPAEENWLVWSPDGTRVVLNALLPSRSQLLESPVRAFQPREVLATDGGGAWPVSWSPDGRTVLYVTNSPDTSNDVWAAPVDGSAKPSPFQHTRASENWAAFSPDGKWVAFSTTAASDVPEVFVTRYPEAGQSYRISADGGSQARWRRNGEIVYLAPDRMLMSASVSEQDGRIAVSRIDPLFTLAVAYGAYHAFDVSADGMRILANVNIGAGVPTQQARTETRAW